jgi:hypothetical protein
MLKVDGHVETASSRFTSPPHFVETASSRFVVWLRGLVFLEEPGRLFYGLFGFFLKSLEGSSTRCLVFL